MGMSIRQIVGMAVSLLVIAVISPIAFVYLVNAGDTNVLINGVNKTINGSGNAAIGTLLTILLPIVAVVGLIIAFVPNREG